MILYHAFHGSGYRHVVTTGLDPWIEGPAIAIPDDCLLRVTIRMKSTADRSGEVFYGTGFKPENANQFSIEPDGG